jgi:hypothetical protein
MGGDGWARVKTPCVCASAARGVKVGSRAAKQGFTAHEEYSAKAKSPAFERQGMICSKAYISGIPAAFSWQLCGGGKGVRRSPSRDHHRDRHRRLAADKFWTSKLALGIAPQGFVRIGWHHLLDPASSRWMPLGTARRACNALKGRSPGSCGALCPCLGATRRRASVAAVESRLPASRRGSWTRWAGWGGTSGLRC